MKRIIIFLFLLVCVFPLSSFAGSAEVAQLILQLHQLKQQYELLKKTYSEAQDQLDEAKKLRADAEGHYGYGGLLNDAKDFKDREWSPGNWDDAVKGASGGNSARYRQLQAEYKKNHPSMSNSEYAKDTNKDQARTYQQQVGVNRAAMVNATYAYNDINKHLQTIHKLSEQIEKTKDEKAVSDLNARLLAEIAYIQTQELKMQILLNQQMAQNSSDNIDAETRAAKFDELPK